MVTECRALGLTPMTEAEFAEDEKRMYRDLTRRRNGDYGVPEWPSKSHSCYR